MVEGALSGETPAASGPNRESPRPRFARVGILARLWRNERGTAVVEFSLIVLPLVLIVVGILDFGRALNYYNALTQIAGQGSRAASVNQNPLGGAASATFQHQLGCAATSDELRRDIRVRITTAPTTVGDPVTITTSYRFKFIPLLRVGLTLSAAQTQRYESSAAPSYSSASDITTTGGVGACP